MSNNEQAKSHAAVAEGVLDDRKTLDAELACKSENLLVRISNLRLKTDRLERELTHATLAKEVAEAEIAKLTESRDGWIALYNAQRKDWEGVCEHNGRLIEATFESTLAKEAAEKELVAAVDRTEEALGYAETANALRLAAEKEVGELKHDMERLFAADTEHLNGMLAAEQRVAAMELRLRAIITQAHNLPASETAVKIVAIAAQSGSGG